MLKSVVFAAVFAFAASSIANAAILPAPVSAGDSAIVRVAEGCGPGYWRGPHGHCHPFAMHRMCPHGYHLGPEGRRCWPN